MRGQAFIAASVVATALFAASPASAQAYPTYQDGQTAQDQCERANRDRTVGGVVLGAIAGAVLGHNVAGGHGSRDEGTALGAVVGGAAGGAIGHSMNGQCPSDAANSSDPYYGNANESPPPPDDQYGDNPSDNDQYSDDPSDNDQYGDDQSQDDGKGGDLDGAPYDGGSK